MFEQTFKNIDDVLWKEAGCTTELDAEKLPHLLELKYNALADAVVVLGNVTSIRETFTGFQQHLYG